jgi:drug/metabolite transporter (DMT)-like permease
MGLRQILIPRHQNSPSNTNLAFQSGLTHLDTPKSHLGLASWLLAIVALIAYSTSAPMGRLVIEAGISPTALLAIRYALTILLLGITLGLTDKRRLFIDRRGLLVCIAVGFINGIAAVAFFWSIDYLNASLASMLVSIYPLVVLGLLAFRGEKFTYRNTIRLVLGLVGIYFIIGPGGQLDGLGIILAFISAGGYALHLVLIQWFLPGYDARTVAFYVIGTMGLVAGGFWLGQGAELHNPGWSGWLGIIFLAVIATFLARLATFAAIRGIGTGQVALLAPSETMLTVVWSMLFLSERLTPSQWLGSGLILLSGLLAIQRLRRAKPRTGWRIWLRL